VQNKNCFSNPKNQRFNPKKSGVEQQKLRFKTEKLHVERQNRAAQKIDFFA
jgi:hypothetical protein